MRVLLVCMPWAAVHRPSIGISLLKSSLARRGFAADLQYFNLRWAERVARQLQIKPSANLLADVGRLSYVEQTLLFQITDSHCMADEWIFAQAVFGDVTEPAAFDALMAREFDANEIASIHALRAEVPAFLDECIASVRWEDYSILGLTSTFRQNLASFALAKRVKQLHPQIAIVMGGANCEGEMGQTIVRQLPFIDYVASGEADDSFPELVSRLAERRSLAGLQGIAGRDDRRLVPSGPVTIADLDSLPYPDYDDFFAQRGGLSYRDALEVRLPLEQARGCWWGERSHCTFCGLNGLTMGFRAKSPERAYDELVYMLDRYKTKTIDFCDNILFMGYFDTLLPRLAAMNTGDDHPTLFYEIKSNIKRAQVEILRRAGTRRAQPGIESLSTHVLKLMRKGCTALQNIQCLKWLYQFSIRAEWSIIFGFPGETPEDYAGMIPRLEAITHLTPPRRGARVRMDRFSPNYNEAAQMGFVNVRPMPTYRHLYPFDEAGLASIAYYFDADYADGRDPASYAEPVARFVARWNEARPRGQLIHAPLGDGGAIIRDTRFNRPEAMLMLSAEENAVYLYCDEIRTLDQIVAFAKSTVVGDRVRELLDSWVDLRIMVNEDKRYLAVAPVELPMAYELPQRIADVTEFFGIST